MCINSEMAMGRDSEREREMHVLMYHNWTWFSEGIPVIFAMIVQIQGSYFFEVLLFLRLQPGQPRQVSWEPGSCPLFVQPAVMTCPMPCSAFRWRRRRPSWTWRRWLGIEPGWCAASSEVEVDVCGRAARVMSGKRDRIWNPCCSMLQGNVAK